MRQITWQEVERMATELENRRRLNVEWVRETWHSIIRMMLVLEIKPECSELGQREEMKTGDTHLMKFKKFHLRRSEFGITVDDGLQRRYGMEEEGALREHLVRLLTKERG